jgi:hypothetical protein
MNRWEMSLFRIEEENPEREDVTMEDIDDVKKAALVAELQDAQPTRDLPLSLPLKKQHRAQSNRMVEDTPWKRAESKKTRENMEMLNKERIRCDEKMGRYRQDHSQFTQQRDAVLEIWGEEEFDLDIDLAQPFSFDQWDNAFQSGSEFSRAILIIQHGIRGLPNMQDSLKQKDLPTRIQETPHGWIQIRSTL